MENQKLDDENESLTQQLKDTQASCTQLEERVTKLVVVFQKIERDEKVMR